MGILCRSIGKAGKRCGRSMIWSGRSRRSSRSQLAYSIMASKRFGYKLLKAGAILFGLLIVSAARPGRIFAQAPDPDEFMEECEAADIPKNVSEEFLDFWCDKGRIQDCPTGPVTCFPAGTKVLMGDGTEKNIEAVAIGDRVISQTETGQRLVSRVTALDRSARGRSIPT